MFLLVVVIFGLVDILLLISHYCKEFVTTVSLQLYRRCRTFFFFREKAKGGNDRGKKI